MAVLLVANHPSGERLEHRFIGEVEVGRAVGGFVLPDDEGVAPRHVLFFERNEGVVVRPLAPGALHDGFLIDELYAHDKLVLEGDVVTVGSWTITATPLDEPLDAQHELVPRSDEERDFLDRLRQTPSDDEVRLVYGDWLEENGFTAEAEVLRLERERLGSDERSPDVLDAQLRVAAAPTARSWRMLVGRAPLHGCRHVVDPDDEDDGPCPGTWDRLLPMSASPATRSCGTCGRTVYYTSSASAAQRDLSMNMVVVVDCAAPRSPEAITRPIEPLPRPRPRRPPNTSRSPLELPFFSRSALPSSIGELFESLELRGPPSALREYSADAGRIALPFDELRSRRGIPIDWRAPACRALPAPPPLTELIATFAVHYRFDRDAPPRYFTELATYRYDAFYVIFRVGADALEERLAADFGAPLELPASPDEDPTSLVRAYGQRWVFHRGVDHQPHVSSEGCSLGWSQTIPERVSRWLPAQVTARRPA